MRTTLIRGEAGRVDRALNETADLKVTERLLEQVANNPEMGGLVRIYRPAPTVAFSGRERRLPGFRAAVGESLAFSFEPVIRSAGGRMVALDPDWIVMDIITPEPDRRDNRQVYLEHGQALVEVLNELGVQAALGPVPLEYCPGDYSINARGQVKIVGTAQRVRRGVRLFSISIPHSISVNVREMFTRANELLDLEWNPSTLGSIQAENPDVTIDQLETALIQRFAGSAEAEISLADVFAQTQQLELAG
ncbi:MAG: hypothetical protein RL530_616 [Actinomycetota bacterium]